MSDVRQYLADAFRKRRCTLQVQKVVSAHYEKLEAHLVDARKSIEILTKNAQRQTDEIVNLCSENAKLRKERDEAREARDNSDRAIIRLQTVILELKSLAAVKE